MAHCLSNAADTATTPLSIELLKITLDLFWKSLSLFTELLKIFSCPYRTRGQLKLNRLPCQWTHRWSVFFQFRNISPSVWICATLLKFDSLCDRLSHEMSNFPSNDIYRLRIRQCVRSSKFCFFVSLSLFSSIAQLGDFGDLSSVIRGPYYKPELNNQRSLTTTPLQCLQLQRPSKRGEERNSTAVRCVPIHPLLFLIWKLMCSLTLERSRSFANSVDTNA